MPLVLRFIVLLALILALPTHAHATPAGADISLFRPPATSGGVLSLDSAFTSGHLSVAASLFFDYAHEPVTLSGANGTSSAWIRHQIGLQAAISLSLWKRLEVGVVMPAVLYQTGDAGPDGSHLPKSAAGDLRIEAKAHIAAIPLGKGGRAVGFGLAIGLGLPTGNSSALAGNDGVTVWPRIMVTFLVRPVEIMLELGAVLRGSRLIADLTVGQQMRFGVGARVAVYRGLGLEGSLAGAGPLSGTSGQRAIPLEFLVGPDYRMKRVPIDFILVAGRGLTDGYGAPDARVVLAVRYQPRLPLDRDKDGLPDVDDRCPLIAGPKENRGCPDGDADRDGVIDRLDHCATEEGPKENDGCPWPDRDGDGIVDRLDRCPDVAGVMAQDGCPDVDKDRDEDGIADRLDRCPDERGPAENGGCPDVDSDGDGIPDRLDKCPHEPENFNGVEDDDGCPEAKSPELAVLTETGIEIKQQVFFDAGRAEIKPASYALLAAVAKILELHPEVAVLRIEGHTDNKGTRARNLKLSQARADAVRQRLVTALGIAPNRLVAQGFGPDQPIADNRTDAGRAKNRRSAFVIQSKAGAETK